MNAVIPFEFDTLPVRGINIDGEPWFVLADVCAALEIVNSRDAAKRLDEDEKGVALTDTPSGNQEMNIINESGLYTLVLRCRGATTPGTLPYRFRKWVTAEVLPTIRKTGGYGTEAVLDITAFPTNEVIDLLRQQIELQSELIESLRKKQKHARRDEFIKTARVLFHRTSLSDKEIADAFTDFLGDEMPEWVAYQRRKFDEETATRN
ncbi:MAG: hypothetical protein K9H25_17315 [Rhodospirillum sp.]|nr:hypothetical protein [Rhodospirillum sp.]MCF8502887.1 hypothetical protein [Rhodospirillum sp.]